MSALSIHVDAMVDDMRTFQSEGIVVIIEVDGVVLLVKPHDHPVLQGLLIHHDITRLDAMIDGNTLHEAHEQLRLRLLIADLRYCSVWIPSRTSENTKSPMPASRQRVFTRLCKYRAAKSESHNEQDDDRC